VRGTTSKEGFLKRWQLEFNGMGISFATDRAGPPNRAVVFSDLRQSVSPRLRLSFSII